MGEAILVRYGHIGVVVARRERQNIWRACLFKPTATPHKLTLGGNVYKIAREGDMVGRVFGDISQHGRSNFWQMNAAAAQP